MNNSQNARFGSDTVFNYVRNLVATPDCQEDYEVVSEIIRHICMKTLQRDALPHADKEDITQEVQCSFFSRLVRYVQTHADAAPAQRDAYLYTIIKRRRADHLARYYKDSCVDSYDAEGYPVEQLSSPDDMLSRLSKQETLENALHFVCSQNVPPEQIIAYLYNSSTAVSGKNGKPAEVAKQLSQQPLPIAAELAIEHLQAQCPFPIAPKVFAPLLDKLELPAQDTPDIPKFHMTPREISTATSLITARLRKYWDQPNGGNSL